MSASTWTTLGFALAVVGELTREADTPRWARGTAFFAALICFILALAIRTGAMT